MTLTRKKARTWLCPKCAHRNEVRTSSRKCQGCGEQTKPKRRVPKHAVTLRDMNHEQYAVLNAQIHGAAIVEVSERDGFACGVCGRPQSEARQLDREHDHRTAEPRGLACFRCNRELLRGATLESLRAAVAYLERVEAWYGRA